MPYDAADELFLENSDKSLGIVFLLGSDRAFSNEILILSYYILLYAFRY